MRLSLRAFAREVVLQQNVLLRVVVDELIVYQGLGTRARPKRKENDKYPTKYGEKSHRTRSEI